VADAGPLLLHLLFGGARFLPLVTLTPLFGGAGVPAPVKVGLACALGLVAHGLPGSAPDWTVAGVAAELAAGLVLALPVLFVIKGIEIAGECFDQVCGTNAIEIVFPSGEGRASPVAQITGLAMVIACFRAGVHTQVIGIVAASFDTVPLGAGLALGGRQLDALIAAFSRTVATGVTFGLPFLLIAVAVDAALGFAGRLTPGFSLSPQAAQVKNALALALMVVLSDRVAAGCTAWAQAIGPAVASLLPGGG
jgi:flagellar biosynthesis protein FliR